MKGVFLAFVPPLVMVFSAKLIYDQAASGISTASTFYSFLFALLAVLLGRVIRSFSKNLFLFYVVHVGGMLLLLVSYASGHALQRELTLREHGVYLYRDGYMTLEGLVAVVYEALPAVLFTSLVLLLFYIVMQLVSALRSRSDGSSPATNRSSTQNRSWRLAKS